MEKFMGGGLLEKIESFKKGKKLEVEAMFPSQSTISPKGTLGASLVICFKFLFPEGVEGNKFDGVG
jgi:hypothetical protein